MEIHELFTNLQDEHPYNPLFQAMTAGESPARVLMKVGPKMQPFKILVLRNLMTAGKTKVNRIVPAYDQITRQVSSKVKGNVTNVTKPTIRINETMDEEMLMPMKAVAKTWELNMSIPLPFTNRYLSSSLLLPTCRLNTLEFGTNTSPGN